MKPRGAFPQVLDRLYACGTRADEASQQEVLNCLGEALNSHITAFHLNDSKHHAAVMNVVGGVTRELVNECFERSGGRNTWFERALPKLLSEGIADDKGVMSDTELKSSPFYQEYLRPLDINHGLAFCMFSDAEGGMSAISINRDVRRGYYQPSEQKLALRLLPHLRNIYNLQRQLSWLEAQIASFRAALDRLAFGVVMLNCHGGIVFTNAEAQKMFWEKLGIVDRERRLHAVWPADAQGLQQLIARACGGLLTPTPESMSLHDQRGVAIATATVSPIARVNTLVWSEPNAAAVLFVHRLREPAAFNLDRLRATFGLTQAETELAVQLMAGATLAQAGEKLGKRMPTLRTQLRALFDKTTTRRQSELLRVLERA